MNLNQAIIEVYPTQEEQADESLSFLVTDPSDIDALITRIQRGAYIAAME